MSSGPPPNAPTGPRIPTGPQIPTGPRALQTGNNHNSWVPNPQSLHSHIMSKKALKEYPAITIVPSPPGTRTPLEQRPEMDTRPCMQPSSRTHLLTCGHHIVSPSPPLIHSSDLLQAVNTAEPCATNCDSKAIKEIDVNFAPQPLLTDGDFDCDPCGTQGARVTYAALFYPRIGYSCVVVGRDDRDRAAIAALRGGMVPAGNINRDGDGRGGGRVGYLGGNRGAASGRGVGQRGPMHAGGRGRGDRGRGSASGSGMGRGSASGAGNATRTEWAQRVQEGDMAVRLESEAERLREEAMLVERTRRLAIEDGEWEEEEE